MFRAPLCPSLGALDRILLHMVFNTLCAVWCHGKPASRPCEHGLLPAPEDEHNGARNMLS